MSDWSKNNRACKTLWTTLYNLKQISDNFDDSGTLKMKDLLYYNSVVSADLRKQQATILADQLDNIFRNGRGAVYEADTDRTTSMQSMVEILTDESKELSDLASKIDGCYKFVGE